MDRRGRNDDTPILMTSIANILQLVLQTSLVLALVGVGLRSRWSDLAYALKRPLLVLRAVIAVNVLVPAAAILLTSLFPLQPVVKAGIILMAVAPMAPGVPGMMLKVGASASHTIGLCVLLVLLSILVVPITIGVLSRIYPVDIQFAPATAARLAIGSILAPLLFGAVLGTLWPSFAHRAAKLAQALSRLVLIACLALITFIMWRPMMAMLGDGALLIIVLTIGVGLFAGRLLGGRVEAERSSLSVAAALRHPGLAGAIMAANFADLRIGGVTMMFMLTGIVMTNIYFAALKPRHAPHVSASKAT
jgi:BASS family bile acid:Na+ symporter